MTRRNLLVRSRPIVVAVAFLLAALAALGLAMMRATGGHLVYPLDDTYIQMAIAKNLAAHGTWGVTRYEFSGAGSSPLWPLLLAGIDRLTGLGASLPLIANVLAAVLLITLAHVALKRYIAARAGQSLALGLVIVAAPLPALALVGMEHTLQCAMALGLTLAGVRLCLATSERERRVLLGLTALAAGATVAVRSIQRPSSSRSSS